MSALALFWCRDVAKKEGNPIKVAFLLSDIYCFLVLFVKNYKGSYYTRYPTAKGKEEGDEHRSASFVNYSQRGKQYCQ